MKRTISLLSILAFVLAFSTNAFAQTEVTASATIDAAVTATVQSGGIQFGSLSSSQNIDATIDPTGTNSNVGTGTVSHGKVGITTSGGTSLDITFTATDLVDDQGTAGDASDDETLIFNEAVYGNSTDDAAGATEFSSGGGTHTADSGGNYYLYLGGTIPGSSINGAGGGTYTGTVTLTIQAI